MDPLSEVAVTREAGGRRAVETMVALDYTLSITRSQAMSAATEPEPGAGWVVPLPDPELRVRLGQLLRRRPALAPRASIPAGLTARRAAEHVLTGIANVVREMDRFADEVLSLLAPWRGPVRRGSARSVALSVALLCQAFADDWSQPITPTAERVAQFGQEARAVRAALDEFAYRFADAAYADDAERRPHLYTAITVAVIRATIISETVTSDRVDGAGRLADSILRGRTKGTT